MRIQHNIPAMSAYRNYTNNTSSLAKNLEKLSSGYKINRAGDDAAGLAISEKMRAQITGLEVAQKNAKDGISLVQTAEGALTEVHDMLNRMYELAEQSANGTYDNDVDRYQLQKELNALRTEVDRIADSANFNGIKLLDGSLSDADLTVSGISTSVVDTAKGVKVTQGTNGGGSHGEYSINITEAFGAGDKLSLVIGGKDAKTLDATYGTDFKGDTLEEQAKDLARFLGTDSAVAGNFKIDVEGTTVKLTSLVEGNNLNAGADQTSTITSATVTNKTASADATNWKATAGADSDDKGAVKFATLFDGTTNGSGIDLKEGDELTIEALLGGKTMSVTLTAGKDFQIGPSNADTLNNLVNTLTNTAKFDDNPDTVADESQIKFSDVFTVAAGNTGRDLELTNKTSLMAAATDVTIRTSTGKSATSAAKTAIDPTSQTKAKFEMVLASGGTDAADLSIGDKLTIQGELADGRTFEVVVEAGKDFKIGANYTGTMDNLKKALEDSGVEVKLKKNGKDDGTVSSKEIFGATKEISFANTGTFESNNFGTTLVSKVTGVTLTNGNDTAVSNTLTNGAQRSSANSTIDFSAGVEYGATIEVDGQKYEIVKDAKDVSSARNNAVVVGDLSDTSAIAKAMSNAIKDNLDSSLYTVSTSGSRVTVSSVEVGSEAKAVSMSSSGDKTKQIEFTLDPTKMQSGSTVTINGQKYEFVDKGGSTTEAGATAIEVDNWSKATANSLGSALAAAANGVKNANVQVDENGKVTVRGMADADGKLVDPKVSFANGTAGLTLQIGDTSEDFNRMKVGIYNCHASAMGIGDLDISTQEGASEAMSIIKDAVNYISDVRGTLGATQNRLDHTINNLAVMQENIQDAESTIRDVDVAKEMMEYTKNNILVQSAQAMLAQANQLPQGVLQLLQ